MDIDSSKESGHGVMVFHIKKAYAHGQLSRPPPSIAVEPILFLSRTLTPAEKNYFITELEFSAIVWAARKLKAWLEVAPEDKPPIFYTDHIASIYLATSLSTSSLDRLNLRLVRGSQYLQ